MLTFSSLAVVCWYALPYDDWTAFRVHAFPFIIAGLSLGVVVDCLITYSVSYQLVKGRSGVRQYVKCFSMKIVEYTYFNFSTNVMINRLIFYTVNTGAITSYVSAGFVASYKHLMHSQFVCRY